jgi:predicted metal-dependent phosphoesterase TrpH
VHCHQAATEVSKERELGLRECATAAEEAYAQAKRMDFTTITDHDTIAGVLEIAGRPGVSISEELTARSPAATLAAAEV